MTRIESDKIPIIKIQTRNDVDSQFGSVNLSDSDINPTWVRSDGILGMRQEGPTLSGGARHESRIVSGSLNLSLHPSPPAFHPMNPDTAGTLLFLCGQVNPSNTPHPSSMHPQLSDAYISVWNMLPFHPRTPPSSSVWNWDWITCSFSPSSLCTCSWEVRRRRRVL